MLDITKLRAELEKNRCDPSLIAYILRDNPEIKEAGLSEVAWFLSKHEDGCAYQDVAGLLDDLEKWQKSQ